jgi:enediyne biosynthesis protein E4
MFSQTRAKLLAWLLLAGLLWLALANGGGAINISSQSAPIQLKNIAQAAGIHFVLNNSATPHKYQIEPMVAGVAVFDYNNDGLPDLYFVNGARIPDLLKTGPEYYNRLYRNNGDGTFTDVTEQAGVKADGYSMGVAAADYDNDGWEDLYVVGVNRNYLFHNKGDGTFTDAAQEAGLTGVDPKLGKTWSICAGWFDYDRDGWLDLFVANYCVWGLDKDPYCSHSRNSARSYCSPEEFKGLPDMLFHNNHDGTFTDVSVPSGIAEHTGKGMGVAFADYDNDGYPDVFVANDTTRNFLFHNRGNRTFDEVGLQTGVAYNGDGAALSFMGADFRDIDNDGRPDVFVTALSNESFSYFHNEGGRMFEDRSPPTMLSRLSLLMGGWSNGIYDMNNDGWKDLVSVNSHVNNIESEMNVPYKQPNAIFENLGGRFADVSAAAGPDFQARALHRGAAFGDLFNDGRIDLVVSVQNEPAEIFRNVSENGNHWLEIKTVGTKSNRDGIGTKIRLESASGTQFNHVTTSVGYASSSDPRVHFGLGKDTLVKRLTFEWPSGIRQQLTDVKVDQILEVVEPEK